MENMEAKVSLNLTLCYEHRYYAHKLQLKTLLMLKKRRAVQERGHPLQINKYLTIPQLMSALLRFSCVCRGVHWITEPLLLSQKSHKPETAFKLRRNTTKGQLQTLQRKG